MLLGKRYKAVESGRGLEPLMYDLGTEYREQDFVTVLDLDCGDGVVRKLYCQWL